MTSRATELHLAVLALVLTLRALMQSLTGCESEARDMRGVRWRAAQRVYG